MAIGGSTVTVGVLKPGEETGLASANRENLKIMDNTLPEWFVKILEVI